MGYCNGDCKYLNESSHKCGKYGKKLAYMKQSGRGSIGFCVHEQCQICTMDEYIEQITKELEDKTKECEYWKRNCIGSTAQLREIQIWLAQLGCTPEKVLEDCKTIFPDTTCTDYSKT